MALSLKARVLTALCISLLLIGIYAFIGCLGFWMGVMGTDSCRGVEGYAIAYLVLGWPAILLLAALTPGILLLVKVRGWLVALGGAVAFILAMLSYLIYPLLLQSACRPIGSSQSRQTPSSHSKPAAQSSVVWQGVMTQTHSKAPQTSLPSQSLPQPVVAKNPVPNKIATRAAIGRIRFFMVTS